MVELLASAVLVVPVLVALAMAGARAVRRRRSEALAALARELGGSWRDGGGGALELQGRSAGRLVHLRLDAHPGSGERLSVEVEAPEASVDLVVHRDVGVEWFVRHLCRVEELRVRGLDVETADPEAARRFLGGDPGYPIGLLLARPGRLEVRGRTMRLERRLPGVDLRREVDADVALLLRAAGAGAEQPPGGARVLATRAGGVRCPWCHDDLDVTAVDAAACDVCGTAHHRECMEQAAGCTVLGCHAAPLHGPPAQDVPARS